ncbi:hypothetical protein [Paraburkholderia humisilvae]|nr:hypothetical protein [Paraburkholderia humisilvae]
MLELASFLSRLRLPDDAPVETQDLPLEATRDVAFSFLPVESPRALVERAPLAAEHVTHQSTALAPSRQKRQTMWLLEQIAPHFVEAFEPSSTTASPPITNEVATILRYVHIRANSLAWINLDRAQARIHTATAALVAVSQRRRGNVEAIERIMMRMSRYGPTVLLKQRIPVGSLFDNAALLYSATRPEGTGALPSMTARRHMAQRHRAFLAQLADEALQASLFNPAALAPSERAETIHFDGNALVHAAGKTLDDLARDHAVMRFPVLASLSHATRVEKVRQWLNAHGQDTQYPVGTLENSMASVLKTAALARGQAAPPPYASPQAVGEAFVQFARHRNSNTLIDPRILLGLHLIKSNGIFLNGTSADRLATLRSYVNDLLTELSGPPRWDLKATASALLQQKTGFTEAELMRKLAEQHIPLLPVDTLDNTAPRLFTYPLSIKDHAGQPQPVTLSVVELKAHAQAAFDRKLTEWFSARARQSLRRDRQPLTDAAVAAQESALAAAHAQASPSTLMHWLENMPLVGTVVGFGEGVAHGDVAEIISAVPVIGNLYNIGEGVRTGDAQRVAVASITLIPFAGAGYIMLDGIAKHDTAQAVGGALGLGLDFVTFGEGHLLSKGRLAGHSALGEGRLATRTFTTAELPAEIRLQAQHSLNALHDLGINDRALAIKAHTGTVGSFKDPFGLAIREKRLPALTTSMATLTQRLTPVPAAKRPVMMRFFPEDGTWQNPRTLARYAEIGPNLYRLHRDPAFSVPEHAIWNPVTPEGNGRLATVKLEYAHDQWQIAQKLPRLQGGAPALVFRVINGEAAKPLNREIPASNPYIRWHRHVAEQADELKPMHVSETYTVHWTAYTMRQALDVSKHYNMKESFDSYFEVRFKNEDGSLKTDTNKTNAVRNFYHDLYEKSATFRGLYNWAIDNRRLTPKKKIKINLHSQGTEEAAASHGLLTINTSDLDWPHSSPDKFVTVGGKLESSTPKEALIHESIHIFTDLYDPDHSAWTSPDVLTRDSFNLFGFGERGPVVYLTDRIMKEAGMSSSPRLTYLITNEAQLGRLASDGAVFDYTSLEQYVKLQDAYLDALFPAAYEEQTVGLDSAATYSQSNMNQQRPRLRVI